MRGAKYRIRQILLQLPWTYETDFGRFPRSLSRAEILSRCIPLFPTSDCSDRVLVLGRDRGGVSGAFRLRPGVDNSGARRNLATTNSRTWRVGSARLIRLPVRQVGATRQTRSRRIWAFPARIGVIAAPLLLREQVRFFCYDRCFRPPLLRGRSHGPWFTCYRLPKAKISPRNGISLWQRGRASMSAQRTC